MQALFPPMDTIYEGKTRSYWREFEFMLHQIQIAIEPPALTLRQTIEQWPAIKRDLAEASRVRILQIDFCP